MDQENREPAEDALTVLDTFTFFVRYSRISLKFITWPQRVPDFLFTWRMLWQYWIRSRKSGTQTYPILSKHLHGLLVFILRKNNKKQQHFLICFLYFSQYFVDYVLQKMKRIQYCQSIFAVFPISLDSIVHVSWSFNRVQWLWLS